MKTFLMLALPLAPVAFLILMWYLGHRQLVAQRKHNAAQLAKFEADCQCAREEHNRRTAQ